MPATAPERYVYVSDVHGSHDAFARLVDQYDLDKVRIALLGDSINGDPDSDKVLQLAIDIEADVVAGNHDVGLHKVLARPETCDREDWRVGLHRTLLKSYGVDLRRDRLDMREDLLQAMKERGHLDLILNGLRPYIETPTAIGVHAGLLPTFSWEEQKAMLDAWWSSDRRYQEKPQQIFDPHHSLSKLTRLPAEVTAKDVVSGHWHKHRWAKRIREGRIQLGSAPPFGPLFALELPSREITAFERRVPRRRR